MFPTYPAITFAQATELAIFSANQLHELINGSETDVVVAEDGDIDSVRKTLKYVRDLGNAQFRAIISDQNIVYSEDFKEYLMDVSSVPLNITLPASSNIGAKVWVYDYQGNSATNNITILANSGDTVDGGASLVVNTNDSYITLYKVSATNWVSRSE